VTKEPEPSKEEVLETIAGILREGDGRKGKPDAEAEKIAAGLAEILFEPPPPLPPEPKPDWIGRLFNFLAGFLPALVAVAATGAFIAGSAAVLHRLGSDNGTIVAYIISAVFMLGPAMLLPFVEPGRSLRRRKGRKAWRYVCWALAWGGLLAAVSRDWAVVAACAAFVFATQFCLPWLVEALFVPLRRGADVLEAKFRRLVGVPGPPLELTSEVEPGKE